MTRDRGKKIQRGKFGLCKKTCNLTGTLIKGLLFPIIPNPKPSHLKARHVNSRFFTGSPVQWKIPTPHVRCLEELFIMVIFI
jgi:hypothetical protein